MIPILGLAFYFYCLWSRSNNRKTEEKLNSDINSYASVLRKLSSSQVREIGNIVKSTLRAMSADPNEWPLELCKLLHAENKVQSEKSYGSPSYEQNKEIDRLIASFELQMSTVAPTTQGALSRAYNDGGLDFGIITNKASHAALYNVMDAHERNMSYNRMNDTIKEMVDKEVKQFISKIRNCL